MKSYEEYRSGGKTDNALGKRLALISECSKHLSYSDTLTENVNVVLEEITNVLEADACVVRTLKDDRLYLLGAYGTPVEKLHHALDVNEGLAHVMVHERRPTAIVAADEDPVTAAIDRRIRDRGDAREFRFHSFAGAPMFADGEVVGVLGLYMIKSTRAFGARDLELLQILANAVGMALANNRLLRKIAEAGPSMRSHITQLLETNEAPDGKGQGPTDPENSAGDKSNETRLEFDLRRSIADIVAHYQPIRTPVENRIGGYEALARWRHPSYGQISPLRFIPLAERTGIIREIGRTMAMNAIKTLKMTGDGPDAPFVSVNVSVHELNNVNFASENIDLIEEYEIHPSRLVFEITERAVLDRTSEAGQTIARLASYGFPLYIDDFGAGYSSLSHLIDLPLTGIKIDPIFIPASDEEKRRIRMLATILTLAKDIGLTVIAEGIETPFQAELARSLQIDFVQGFSVGRPAFMAN